MKKSVVPRAAILVLALAPIFCLAQQAANPNNRPVLLTGEVQAKNAQGIFVPPSNSSPVTIKNFVPEGTVVKTGDLLLRIETSNAENIEKLQSEIQKTSAKTKMDVAKLDVDALNAEKEFIIAKATLAKALVNAALPKVQISALDYDKYQGEKEHAQRDVIVKQQAFDNAKLAAKRRQQDGDLENKKQLIYLAFAKAELAQSEVHATQDGIVTHAYNEWRGERFEEGSSGFPGNMAGQVMSAGGLQIQTWALEADRPYLNEKQTVQLSFDALPGSRLEAKITHIASAPTPHASWGNGRYFKIDIDLPKDHGLKLIPGMSVLIEPKQATKAAAKGTAETSAKTSAKTSISANSKVQKPGKAASNEINIEGDVQSHITIPVVPPTIRNIWNYTLFQIAPEGSIIEPGQMLAMFQASEISLQLEAQKSALKEWQRSLEKFKLNQRELEKSDELAVQEAQSNADKAAKKALMPKELIRRVDYDKLVIEKGMTSDLAALAARLQAAQSRYREAEYNGNIAQIAQIQNTIDIYSKGQEALTVNAPRRGMLLYKTDFSGNKFTSGAQIWIGMAVASLADPDKLFVNAKVPEAQVSDVYIGQAARVTMSSGNLQLNAKVTGLGNVFHGKSAKQAIIVRDIELEFDAPPKGLKPGSAVQVTLFKDQKTVTTTSPTSTVSGKGL